MQDCATHPMRFETHASLALEAAFDGGRLTSDAGIVWLAEMDKELGLCEAISEHVEEWRNRRGLHPLVSLVRQRAFQIACGYEDQNDSQRVACRLIGMGGMGEYWHESVLERSQAEDTGHL